MIVKLTDKQYKAIGFWASRGYPVWQAIYDSLVELEDDDGDPTGEYGVDEGDDGETAQELLDAFYEEQESGHDPFQGVTDDVREVADRIYDHMNYGLSYGFEEHDWE